MDSPTEKTSQQIKTITRVTINLIVRNVDADTVHELAQLMAENVTSVARPIISRRCAESKAVVVKVVAKSHR